MPMRNKNTLLYIPRASSQLLEKLVIAVTSMRMKAIRGIFLLKSLSL
jgi:hypothetical protein